MRLRERRALDATVRRRPDLRQSIEVRAQAVGVDAKRHRGDASAVEAPSRGRVPPTVIPPVVSWHETDSVTAHQRCHAVVMRDNEMQTSAGHAIGPSSCNAIRIASTGTPSRR